jgi:GTP-binding protein HflX
LKGLGVGDRPRLHVLNKIDQLTPQYAAALNGNHNSVRVSGSTGAGLEELLYRIDAAMPVDPILHLQFELPLKDGRAIALVHALGRVLHSEVHGAVMAMQAEVPASVARRLGISLEPVVA